MKVKAIENFAHTSGKVFQIGQTYEVSDSSAKDFADAKLCIIIEEKKQKQTKGE
jgi:hypothetical protein